MSSTTPTPPRPTRPRHTQSPMMRELLRRRSSHGHAANTRLLPASMPRPPPDYNPVRHPPPTRPESQHDPPQQLPHLIRQNTRSLSPAITNYAPPPTTSYGTPLTRRKALLVGIGYRTHRFLRPLPGCSNDVRNMFALLTGPMFQFPSENVRVLCDEFSSIADVSVHMPTRQLILKNLRWLTTDVSPGDSVVFFFAGHGDFVEDVSGDEIDSGLDQCIMPMDYEAVPTHGAGNLPRGAPAILDDTIYERLVRTVPEGAKVTAIVDACRSGTVCDLPVQYLPDGRPRYRNGGNAPPREVHRPYLPAGGCVLFSGSSDTQMSADMVQEDGQSCGIMTKSFVEACTEMCSARSGDYDGLESWTYAGFMDRVRTLVREKALRVVPQYVEMQEPQLSTSHPIDISATPFSL